MLLGLRGWVRALARAKLPQQDHRSNIHCKPPKDNIGPGQTVFTMSVFALALLVPAGWIMHHIPVYKQRPPPEV
ncbi:cytochrome c oxidase subunit 8B, mitochondrial-like [Astyanax mexicanus]|uniref:Cytochrome c oxidase subunit 8B, mitochondrial-like n=1 Tax=Astyanax mexicanus TaxID=7994 RepID=A0A8T2LAV7_ASTMX|nr:cytochrome c oxidase subunit 8B, mitochondrial-like [Astyanax mexicanus]